MARLAAHALVPQRSERDQEDDLQKDVAAFLRMAWPAELPWWHTPNGGSRAKVTRIDRRTGKPYSFSPEALKLKEMGTLAGVPDLAFIMPNARIAFIELKVGANALSDPQIEFKERVIACRCGYRVARSVEEVERICAEWLGLYDLTLRATLAQWLAQRAVSKLRRSRR